MPRWPIQRLLLEQPEHKGRAVVLFAESARGLSVVNCSPTASGWGIRPGMPLAEARAFAGDSEKSLITERSVPAVDQAALCGLAVICQTYGPLVGLEESVPPESLLLDITGCAPHFGGEEGLSRNLRRDFVTQSCHVRIAIADTVGAAWAVAHFATAKNNPVSIIASGQHPAALRPLPIAGLRLPPKTLEILGKLDLRTIGQVERLPRSTLPSRFGDELRLRLDQAWGVAHELIAPVRLPEPVSAVWNLEEPVSGRPTLELISRELLSRILAELQPLRFGIRELESRFIGLADTFTLTLRLVHPSIDERHLWNLLSLEWERQEREFQRSNSIPRCLLEGVATVRLTVLDSAPLRVRQQTLFDMEPGQREEQSFRQLVERLGSRLGSTAVLQTRSVPDPQPELACEFVAWGDAPTNTTAGQPGAWDAFLARSRPLRLLHQPQLVQVLAATPDGPPHCLWWNDQQLIVTQVCGPERIATGWWREQDIQRDYYRVQTDQGPCLWIFRCLLTGAWFLHGSYE